MITLYGCPYTRSTRAAWALEEAGAEYEYVKVDISAGEGRALSYRRINLGGKVPALVDGDFVLTESAAIIAYIGDQYPQARLIPISDARLRGLYDQWCYFVIGELEQPLWTIAKHRFALPEDWRVPAVIDTAIKEFAQPLKVLESGLGDQPFILGETFTGADILIAHTLAWAKKYELAPQSERLQAYMDRTLSRPALTRAREREAG
ncbi:MAG: glutathione S-transferase family protein [Methylococcaceae bacterium]|nr:glutathione S-transferase family protein [Methylococcaceae bacterium]